MWSRKNAEERANNRIIPYDMVGTTYSPSCELEGGPSGEAKERETEDGSEEERMCIWVKAMEWISQILHRSYSVAPASRRSFTMAA